jgi:DNA-binding transcriptional MerR regulator
MLYDTRVPSPLDRLRQGEVAHRWQLSPRTLERWRWLGLGPAYIKVGGRVVYRLEDILAYEAAQRRGGR